jgi:signal transduction histidine kinase
MRWRHSVIWRFAALVFLMQIACVLLALWAVHQFTGRAVDHASREIAIGLRDDIAATYAAAGLAAAGATVRNRIAADPSGSAVILLLAPDGHRIAGNLDRWPADVGTAGAWRPVTFHPDGRAGKAQAIGIVGTRFPDGTRLLTGRVIERDIRFDHYLEAALLGAILLALPLAAGAAWVSAAIIQRRLRAVIDTAAAVGTGAMERRIVLSDSGDMFDALGSEINAMLDRITGLVGELRLVTDGLAHDLRSPLTRLRAVLERALAQSKDDVAIGALERALDEGDTLLRMLDAALLISRAEAGIGRDSFAPVDVAALLYDFQDMYGAVADDRNIIISVEAEAKLVIRSHREIFGQVLSNLIDNALKYGGDHISLSACRQDGEIVVQVSDNGPGIAEERRVEALRRFARLDASRHITGAGLGLSLAAAVARLHGGDLVLSDAKPGLCVTITIPAEGTASD